MCTFIIDFFHLAFSMFLHVVHTSVLHYFLLQNSRTWLSDFPFTFHFHALEKEMATHSSVLAWRIPGTGEPGGLPSMGPHRVGHDWSDLAAAAAAVFHCMAIIIFYLSILQLRGIWLISTSQLLLWSEFLAIMSYLRLIWIYPLFPPICVPICRAK